MDSVTTYIYTYVTTLSLPDALPIYLFHAADPSPTRGENPDAASTSGRRDGRLRHALDRRYGSAGSSRSPAPVAHIRPSTAPLLRGSISSSNATVSAGQTVICTQVAGCRSEEHTSELKSLMRISY